MSEKKELLRLDQLVNRLHPDLSRSRIKALIMAGKVKVKGTAIDKAGALVNPGDNIELMVSDNPYVSRGGLKLAAALEDFQIDVNGKIALDAGASTGGFTDCLLKKGARLVYALDVGYGQLDWKLRRDDRVVAMERTNVRGLKKENLKEQPGLAVVDVSFISLTLVVPVLFELTIEEIVLLVKPQFEAGKAEADKGKGVIRSPHLHRQVLDELIKAMRQSGYCVQGVTYSPLPGPKGNLEFFLHGRLRGAVCSCPDGLEEAVEWTVEKAHRMLPLLKGAAGAPPDSAE